MSADKEGTSMPDFFNRVVGEVNVKREKTFYTISPVFVRYHKRQW